MKKKISTEDAPQAPSILSQAISCNGFIYVAGQVHNTIDGTMIDGSVENKVAQIMRNIAAILRAADTSLSDVVKATVYVTDMAQLPELNAIYPRYFTDPLPAR